LTNYIITRHPATIEWLGTQSIRGINIERVTPENIKIFQPGDITFGNIPVALVKKLLVKKVRVVLISFRTSSQHPHNNSTVEEMLERKPHLVEVTEVRYMPYKPKS
jgi:putative CRISPR-associated protein (TIGR02620 family)